MKTHYSLKRSISLLVIIITFVIFGALGASKFYTSQLEQENTKANKYAEGQLEIHELQFHIVQIQQFLTDVSATGDKDGFSDAEENFIAANKALEKLS